MVAIFFFFKQKTAYEMRISDWSSDVCSSDLLQVGDLLAQHGGGTDIGLHVLDRPYAADQRDGRRLADGLARHGGIAVEVDAVGDYLQALFRRTMAALQGLVAAIPRDDTPLDRASGWRRVCQSV